MEHGEYLSLSVLDMPHTGILTSRIIIIIDYMRNNFEFEGTYRPLLLRCLASTYLYVHSVFLSFIVPKGATTLLAARLNWSNDVPAALFHMTEPGDLHVLFILSRDFLNEFLNFLRDIYLPKTS